MGTICSASSVRIIAAWCRPNQRLDRGTSAIGVQVGDVLGDQDDGHQHRGGYVLSAEKRDDGCYGHEQFGADLALVPQFDHASFGQRIQAEPEREQQERKGQQPPPVQERQRRKDDDSRRFPPSGGCE
jgi:hypothetical protein